MPEVFERYQSKVIAELRGIIDGSSLPLYPLLGYHMGWMDEKGNPTVSEHSGKLLRPIFCLMSCETTGGEWEKALPAAAAIELIHNFSLIHDDIEDNSKERRHRPTLWAIWGQETAINAGDAMHVLGEGAMLGLLQRGVPPEKVLEAIRMLNETCLRLCEGQHLDLSYETRLDITTQDYLKMIGGKTAALLECSFGLGAYLGTDQQQIVRRFQDCGRYLGMAFQIRDDILGIWGGENITGKSSESDLQHKKKTLPVVYALEHTDGAERAELLSLFEKEEITIKDIDGVRGVLEKAGSKDYAQTIAIKYYSLGIAELDRSGLKGETFDALKELTAMVVNRDY